jgi:signal transduction histidine kinase
MAEGPVRVLLVDDDEDDYILTRALLEDAGPDRYLLEWSSSFEDALSQAARDVHDVCLMDYRLGPRTGVELLEEARRQGYSGPVILLTGQDDRAVDVEAMRAGATDYLIKGRVDAGGLERAIRYAIERRRLQTQLAVADRLAAVGTLASGVAHEVNNPMMVIETSLDLLRAELANLRSGERAPSEATLGELGTLVDDARSSARQVSRIVADLETFSRSSDDAVRSVDLGRVIDAALSIVRNQLQHKARLTTDVPADLPPIRGNESRLAQVFVNLLVNAGQAVDDHAGPHPPAVGIQVEVVGPDRVQVSVWDTGAGIPPEVKGRVFDPFFTTRGPRGGPGLGLAIAQRTVQEMGGAISLDSEVGVGTTVRVLLPTARRRTVDVAGRGPRPEASPGRERGLAILVVDDDPMVSKAVRRLCRGHEVTTADGGGEALATLDDPTRSFDLVLCDLMMPEVDGVAVFEAISARWPELRERVVFMTGGAFTPRARAFLDQVPNPRLQKPFDAEALQAILDDVPR